MPHPTRSDGNPPLTSAQVRERIAEALALDLVGPPPGHEYAHEIFPSGNKPSNWYLTGFLVPSGAPPERRSDPDADEDLGVVQLELGLPEESVEEGRAARKGFFPSSMGLSFLVHKDARQLTITISWGEYALPTNPGTGSRSKNGWQRTPRSETVLVELRTSGVSQDTDVPGSDGLKVHVVHTPIPTNAYEEYLPAGTLSVSVFLVNRRTSKSDPPDLDYVFQTAIDVTCDQPFVPRPDLHGLDAKEWDDRVADLHYADTPEYATGHGVSADWTMVEGVCRSVRTTWMPRAEVENTETVEVAGVELSMDALGALADGSAVRDALLPLVTAYRTWIDERRTSLSTQHGTRHETAGGLLDAASFATQRIERGIELLARDTDILDAFRMANRAVSRALKQRLHIEAPRWRAFQLAFLVLNLPGMAHPEDPQREIVDLLFFPTGGGKTEAYLGLAAFAMVFRRLRHPEDRGLAGAGISVIMRYTLRLLTLDQLSRSAGLVCALELERRADPARYGAWPFEIGLWVGKAATPNVMGHNGDNDSESARSKVVRYKADPKNQPVPIPLEACPWCGATFDETSFALLPDSDQPEELRIVCTNYECDFTRDSPLPILAVDDPIYRRLPSFLIATVDKFASLPWVGKTGVLLGGADRYDTHGFYGAAEPHLGKGLSVPLPPPDLIIQDELHMISGPLGTMAGLYETALDALCRREPEGRAIRPKIVASTATVRQAQDQIQALFGRSITQVFPPPGPTRQDSFFARTVSSAEKAARLYVGIAAQGRNPKVVLRRTWLALMGSAMRAFEDAGGKSNPENPVDPYMTVLGYFNSLRELGGARRILEEEVQSTIKQYGARRRIDEERGLFADRKSFSEVMELTSRVSTGKVAEARRRLDQRYDQKLAVDCAIATNMISVGLDIQRLGLMVVFGQPKTHAEYIQATSRVGRDEQRPGLVVSLLNIHKPRDRSHYERFRHYHETFYRSVEVSSVTPFSARALDRGFAGALVGLARHLLRDMTPAEGVEMIMSLRMELENSLHDIFKNRVCAQPIIDKDELDEKLVSVRHRIVDLLVSWQTVFESNHKVGVGMKYQKNERSQKKPLLLDILDDTKGSLHHRKFRMGRSLRDVEPDVNLFLEDLN